MIVRAATRPRPGPAVPTATRGPNETTWDETLARLAAVHRDRRAAEHAVRWPLAHAHPFGTPPGDADAGSPAIVTTHAFCCRALA